MNPSLHDVYRLLDRELGPQHWWPADSPFEVMVGAILVQNTSWKNVERALDQLREADLLSFSALDAVPIEDLAELLRPVGYYRVKAGRLRNLLDLISRQFDGSIDAMLACDSETLRGRLLAVRGIGPETADSILLYAAEHPSFVVDTYTLRILARHGWVAYGTEYHDLKEYCEQQLPQDVDLFNQFHALLVRVGHDYCKRRQPLCEACPLASLLPASGIVEEA